MLRFVSDPRVRRVGALAVAAVLALVVFLQRSTIADAVAEIGGLQTGTIGILVVLGIVERLSRAEVIRYLLPTLSLTRSEMISDIGAAASKGIPAGGPIATVLRWQLARDRGIGASGFIVMLVASGVATAFVSWGYPLTATVVDAAGRSFDVADLVIIGVCIAVLGGSATFWVFALRSERAHRFAADRSAWILNRWPLGVKSDEAVEVISEVRAGLRSIAGRPAGLLARTLVAQGTGAVILLVSLRGLGVGNELGVTEFARVFFVAHILGSLAPTPGGVGVIEAGVTGALVAAGVDTEVALAAVLVYRFITYFLPIMIGTVWYLVWRATERGPATPPPPASGDDTNRPHDAGSVPARSVDLPLD